MTSVLLALRHVGAEAQVTSDPEEFLRADRAVFPGVGAAGAAMAELRARGFDDAIQEFLRRGRPLLGICIGCQVALDASEEDGGTTCLGVIPGEVRRFQFPAGVDRKVPHMGWNEVTFVKDHVLFDGIPNSSQFYFVHSYYPAPESDAVVYGRAEYGTIQFAAALVRDQLLAVQFHAEKSGKPGLRLLKNFLAWCP